MPIQQITKGQAILMKQELGATIERTFNITHDNLVDFNNSVGYQPDLLGGRMMARSMFAASLLSRMLDEEVEGQLVFLSQSIKFHHPVYEGDAITIHIEVTYAYDIELQIVFKAFKQDATLIITGAADIQVLPEPTPAEL